MNFEVIESSSQVLNWLVEYINRMNILQICNHWLQARRQGEFDWFVQTPIYCRAKKGQKGPNFKEHILNFFIAMFLQESRAT